MQFQNSTGANLDLHPCKSGFARFLLDHEVDGVEICLSLTTARDFDERAILKLGDGPADGGDMRTHVFGKALLTRKAEIVVPGIAEQKRIGCLGVGGKFGIAQDEIRKLGEAIPRDRIGGIQFHVLLDLLKSPSDVLHP